MQNAITLLHNGMTLRGMEHIPSSTSGEKVPAVILFHGFTGTKLEPHRLFLKISRKLEERGIASFRFDFLGSGESDGNFEEMTVSKEIAEANSILDFVKNDSRIDPSRVSLLGLSMGGLVASIVAGDRPHDVEKLILLAPAGNMYELITHMIQNENIDVSKPYHDYGGNLVGIELLQDLKTLDVFGRAKHYNGKALIVHGSRDEVVPPVVSKMYQEKCYKENATVHFIEGANHTFDKHEWEIEVIDQVVEFLTS